MANPTAAEFKTLFPQWAATSDTSVDAWIVQAALRFTPSKFGAQWAMAAYLYTGHQLALHNPDAADASGNHLARGPVTADKVGDLSRSYGSTVDMTRIPASLQWLASTVYGQQLIGVIMSRSAARGRVVRTGSSYPGTSRTSDS